ncbi:MAG: DUF4259 domain-containing protein [Anaerolineae bacterium]
MGFWGVNNFENDDAVEWLNDLASSPNPRLIPYTLKIITDNGGEFLEALDCCNALAAAEVVAALKGFPAPRMPEDLQVWIEGRPAPDPEWVQLAMQAAAEIRAASQLQQVWDDAGYTVHWRAVVDNLIARLKQ